MEKWRYEMRVRTSPRLSRVKQGDDDDDDDAAVGQQLQFAQP